MVLHSSIIIPLIPGSSSSCLIFEILTGLQLRVDSTSRCLKKLQPSKVNKDVSILQRTDTTTCELVKGRQKVEVDSTVGAAPDVNVTQSSGNTCDCTCMALACDMQECICYVLALQKIITVLLALGLVSPASPFTAPQEPRAPCIMDLNILEVCRFTRAHIGWCGL